MKRNRRRLPVPQYEFGFTPDTFNLIVETGVDGDRVARKRAETDEARRNAEAAQAALFQPKSQKNEQSPLRQNHSRLQSSPNRSRRLSSGSNKAMEAGIRFPVFLTRAVFDAYVTVPPNAIGQDEAGRLWDIVWMLRFAIRKGTLDNLACRSRSTFVTITVPSSLS